MLKLLKSFFDNVLNRKRLSALQKVENQIFYHVYYEAILTQKLEDLYNHESVDDFFNNNMKSVQEIFKSLPVNLQIEKLKNLKIDKSVFGTTDSAYIDNLIKKADLVHNFILYKYLMLMLNDNENSLDIKKEAVLKAEGNLKLGRDSFEKIFQYLKLNSVLENKESIQIKKIKI